MIWRHRVWAVVASVGRAHAGPGVGKVLLEVVAGLARRPVAWIVFVALACKPDGPLEAKPGVQDTVGMALVDLAEAERS